MRRGKRFLNNDNLLIYVGSAIFFIFVIALGIIMFMLNKTAAKLENNTGEVAQEQQTSQDTESVSTEIGKSVEEQENASIVDTSTNTTTSTNSNSTSTESKATEVKTNNEATKPTDIANSTEVDEPDTKIKESEKSNTEVKKEVSFVKPTEGEIICEFAKDNLIYSETLKEWITHTAVDIKADKTSVIKSAADGIVRSIVNDPRYGLTVVIEHDDGYETVYSNLLTAEFVVEGEEVKQGQTIGTAGYTASFESSMECHLHFEILKDGEYLDPSIYI